jgi:hypothetical protein
MSSLKQYQAVTNQKFFFDPKNKSHITLFKRFLNESRWGGPCPFLLEEPWLSIPDMLKDKYVKSQLSIK